MSESNLLDELDLAVAEAVENSHTYVEPEIPAELVSYLRTLCRSEAVVHAVLEQASVKVCRRLRSSSAESRRARWAKRWRPEERTRTARWLGRIRDQVIFGLHVGQVAQRDASAAAGLRHTIRDNGCLVLHEAAASGYGVPSYLEHTPAEIFAFTHNTWANQDQHNRPPRAWDVTAGSGTGGDYFRSIPGAGIIESDIVVGPAKGVAAADCRRIGSLNQHRGVSESYPGRPELVIRTPDLIFFDPPSIGRPNHSDLYSGAWASLDFAALSREEWLAGVLVTTARAVTLLAPQGLVSLLLRCGNRRHGDVHEDRSLHSDLKELLPRHVEISAEMQLAFASRHPQISLGQTRVPAIHMLLKCRQ